MSFSFFFKKKSSSQVPTTGREKKCFILLCQKISVARNLCSLRGTVSGRLTEGVRSKSCCIWKRAATPTYVHLLLPTGRCSSHRLAAVWPAAARLALRPCSALGRRKLTATARVRCRRRRIRRNAAAPGGASRRAARRIPSRPFAAAPAAFTGGPASCLSDPGPNADRERTSYRLQPRCYLLKAISIAIATRR